jgi:hypothetical protein
VRIAQDTPGDAGQACVAGDDQSPEGLLVSFLHSTDDPLVHAAPLCLPGSSGVYD